MSVVARIRNALPDDALALERIHRRASDVWEEYRAQLAAHPDAITSPDEAIAEKRVRVAVNAAGRPLGFSTVLAVKNAARELEDLFVEPEWMRQGIGRLLVADLAARARSAGAKIIEVTANPNAVAFYSRLGFAVTGETSTRFGPAPRMTLDLFGDVDRAAISDLMTAFLRTVSFEPGTLPAYGDLAELFIPAARLIRNSGVTPEISTVDEFIRERQESVDAGALLSFEEVELSEKTEMFGNIAHRFSPYSKRGVTNRGEIDTRGVISTQFVRTGSGWRISSVAWDDERVGLTVPSR